MGLSDANDAPVMEAEDIISEPLPAMLTRHIAELSVAVDEMLDFMRACGIAADGPSDILREHGGPGQHRSGGRR